MKTTTIAILLALQLSGCGGSNAPANTPPPETVENPSGCPVGEWFSTNGMRDYISVGNDGLFSMHRVDSDATGYVTCTGDQKFVMVIEGSEGNCSPDKNCIGPQYQPAVYYNVQGVGTYQCKWSLSNRILNIYCPGVEYSKGNYFSTSKSYLLH